MLYVTKIDLKYFNYVNKNNNSKSEMNKAELIQKCKKLGIKGLSSKTKTELLQIIMEKEQQPEKQSTTKESKETTELYSMLYGVLDIFLVFYTFQFLIANISN